VLITQGPIPFEIRVIGTRLDILKTFIETCGAKMSQAIPIKTGLAPNAGIENTGIVTSNTNQDEAT
jgi:hypothetical protein